MSKRHYISSWVPVVLIQLFDDSWKEDKNVCEFSTVCVENVLDREIDLDEIAYTVLQNCECTQKCSRIFCRHISPCCSKSPTTSLC